MKAIVIDHFGGPEVLVFKDLPEPEPKAGHATVQVKALGLNHAESHMRKGEWDEYMPVTGLECVGLVTACPGGEFAVGTKVAAIMGGLGRSIPGTYAAYTSVPVSNLLAVDTSLPWDQWAAIPETYATAWSTVFGILDVKRGQTLLVRGATSTIGQAACHLAVNAGAIVTATTRRRERFPQVEAMGVHTVKLESPDLIPEITAAGSNYDAVLNLVGNSVLLDTMTVVRRGGRLCQAGWLGGLQPIADFNPMLQMATGIHFSLFHSKVLGTSEFPLSDVPLQEIVTHVENGDWDAKPTHVYDFADIHEAHRMLDSGEANGKLVLRM